MSPAEEDRRHPGDEPGLILFRLAAVEDVQKETRKELRESFRSLEAHIAALAFVPMSLYLSERDGIRKDIADMGDDVSDARKIALSALGTIASAVIGAIIMVVVASLK